MKGKMAIVVMLMLVAFSSSALAGCGSFCCPDCLTYKCTPREDFGRAYMMARDGQILNPYAENNLTPVAGIDGRAAVKIMKSYMNSFAQQQAAPSSGGHTSFAVTQNPGGDMH